MKLNIVPMTEQEDDGLELVAARIKPLPGSVLPSENFQQQMKLRILELGSLPKARVKKAA